MDPVYLREKLGTVILMLMPATGDGYPKALADSFHEVTLGLMPDPEDYAVASANLEGEEPEWLRTIMDAINTNNIQEQVPGEGRWMTKARAMTTHEIYNYCLAVFELYCSLGEHVERG